MKRLISGIGGFLYVLSLVALLAACGGGGSEGGNNDGQTPPPDNSDTDNNGGSNGADEEPDCDITIASIVEDLDTLFPDNVPSWEQLDCYSGSLVRLPNPEFMLMVGDTPPEEDFNPENPRVWWDYVQNGLMFAEEWPEANMVGVNLSEAPPYLRGDGELYTDEEWDMKLRGMAAYGIYLKSQGMRLKADFFYPPSYFQPGAGLFPEMTSKEDFLAWWEEFYVPQRVEIAEVAELIKAEYYQPWDVEAGQFIRTLGDGWLENLEPEEQVEVTQQAVDMMYEAIRPIFSGTLVAISYDRYAFNGEAWKALDFSEWDQVHFILFTEGNVEATTNYLEEQLAGYAEMAERDELQNWVIEVSVSQQTHEVLLEDESFEEIEGGIYQAFFDAISTLPISGIGIATGNIVTEEADMLVRDMYETFDLENE